MGRCTEPPGEAQASLASASHPPLAPLASWVPSSGRTPAPPPAAWQCGWRLQIPLHRGTPRGAPGSHPHLRAGQPSPASESPSLPSALRGTEAPDQPAQSHVPPRSALGTDAEGRPLPLRLLRFSFLLPHTLVVLHLLYRSSQSPCLLLSDFIGRKPRGIQHCRLKAEAQPNSHRCRFNKQLYPK